MRGPKIDPHVRYDWMSSPIDPGWNLYPLRFGGDYTPQSSFDKVIGSLGKVGPEPIVINEVMAQDKWVARVMTLLIGLTTPFVTGWGPPCTFH